MKSPYARVPLSRWPAVTGQLLGHFPLRMEELVKIVLDSWEDIFHSRIGAHAYQIGVHVWPEPQIMGFLLHELIPLNLQTVYPQEWRRGLASRECDAHHIRHDEFSFEIKTSSSTSGIFGNRSYAHVSPRATKRRSGYMLAVNFEKFVRGGPRPEIALVRFGWLDAADWVGQKAESGQQSHLTKEARAYKLKILFEKSEQ